MLRSAHFSSPTFGSGLFHLLCISLQPFFIYPWCWLTLPRLKKVAVLLLDIFITFPYTFCLQPYFDQTKEEKAARKAKKDQAAASRKCKAANVLTSQTPAKRPQSDQSESGNVGPALRPSAPTTLTDLRARFIALPPRRPLVANQPHTANSAAGKPTALPQNIESDSDSESDGDEAVALEERCEVYRKDKAPVTSRRKPKKDGNELSPEMDDMINAGSDRCRHIKCYRVPARLYFGSDKTENAGPTCLMAAPVVLRVVGADEYAPDGVRTCHFEVEELHDKYDKLVAQPGCALN
ncbi:hypothetical protein B0H16DRAFT_1725485 [Mycena metata]|uniref:Uncharacterized protein n=1 Tax=Mycena metata TaxID=1033252 RepID=A0AAD7IRE5_9AGAR|nr:hypothetical protein B0H16DRAFT_1725485 [Mycena metata]